MKRPTEQVQRSALLAVACKTILLGVCDDLKETTLYKQRTKHLVNELTADLSAFVAKMYKGISDAEEAQYIALQRTVEGAANLMASMSPTEIDNLYALLLAYKNGEVFQANSDKGMEGLIKAKRLKKVEPIGSIHPLTGKLV